MVFYKWLNRGNYKFSQTHEPSKVPSLGSFLNMKKLQLSPRVISSEREFIEYIEFYGEADTFNIILNHLLKSLLSIWVFGIIVMSDFFERLRFIEEFFLHLWFDVKTTSNITVYTGKNSSGSIRKAYRFYSYIREIFDRLPHTVSRFIYQRLLAASPTNLREFQDAIPPINLPGSLGLILKLSKFLAPFPPDVPHPYLDSNRNVVAPNQEEVQSAISQRHEYYTQHSIYIATEKVRMLSEIGRFITWNSLIPDIEHINIYENYGILWYNSSVSETLETIGQSILSEFNSFINNFRQVDLNDYYGLIPQIILKEVVSGATYSLFNSSMHHDTVDTVESIVSSYIDKRELIVYFSDERLRNEALLQFTVKNLGLDETLNDKIDEFTPPSVDLILVPETDLSNPLKTLGYFTASSNENEAESVVYANSSRLIFNFFSKSLYHYSITKELIQNSTSEVITLNQSIQSSSGSQYLVSFFERLINLRLFDIRSSRDQPVQFNIDAYSPFFDDDEEGLIDNAVETPAVDKMRY